MTKKQVIRNFGGKVEHFFGKRVTENLISPKQGRMLHRLREDGRPWGEQYFRTFSHLL